MSHPTLREYVLEQCEYGLPCHVDSKTLLDMDNELTRLRASQAELLAACQLEELHDIWSLDWDNLDKRDSLFNLAGKHGYDGDGGITQFVRTFRKTCIAHASEAPP